MSQFQPTAEFASLLTSHQRRLFGYIANFLPNPADTEEVLQQVNVLLWAKAGEFEPGTSFHAWALRIAHYEVLSYFNRMKRDRKVFSAELLDIFAQELSDGDTDLISDTRLALQQCLAKLNQRDRSLVRRHYNEAVTVKQIAEEVGRPPASVYRSLDRIRHLLLLCIEKRLDEEGA